MRVVSNTSPLSNLAIIERLELLSRRYNVIHIPAEVAGELAALTHRPAQARLQAAIAQGWLRVETPAHLPSVALPFPLDAGESAAIALALASRADVLLIDEKCGRAAARNLGLSVGGLLGELLHARARGWISSLRDEIERLRREAGFFVDREIEAFILSQAGE